MSLPDRITVKVPATTANLGPGFDAMGMALDMWNTVTVTPGGSGVTIEGEGEDELPRDESNIVVAGIKSALRSLGAPSRNSGSDVKTASRWPAAWGAVPQRRSPDCLPAWQ